MTTEQAAPPAGPDFKTQIVRIVIPSGASTVVTSAFDAVDSSRTVAVISGIMQHAMMDQEAQDPAEISARVELSTNGAILIATRSSSEVPASTVSVLLIENTAIPSDASEAVVRDHRVIPLSAGQTSPTYDPVGSVNDGNKIVMFDAESIWRAVKQRQQGFKRPR